MCPTEASIVTITLMMEASGTYETTTRLHGATNQMTAILKLHIFG